MDQFDIWIGLVEVRPRPGVRVLGRDQVGAYVTTLALAVDAENYSRVVALSLDSLGLNMIACDEIEPLSERLTRFEVEDSVREIAKCLSDNNRVEFCAFHTYPLNSMRGSNNRITGAR
jgi:hypothetical protein